MKKLNIKKRWQLEADCDSLLLVVTEEYLLTFSKPRIVKRAAKKKARRFKTYPRRTPSTGGLTISSTTGLSLNRRFISSFVLLETELLSGTDTDDTSYLGLS